MVSAKASVTAGFMRPPPYFQNIQTSDVIASQLQRTALNISESVLVTEETLVLLNVWMSEFQSAAV